MNECVAKPANGYNPLRWDCELDGCFNKKLRPKIEMFADCFPGKISFGDVDGLVEISGAFVLMEWKADGGSLGRGQGIAFTNFSKFQNCLVIVVNGNPETMAVDGFSYFWKGKQEAYQRHDLDGLRSFIKRWAAYAARRFPN